MAETARPRYDDPGQTARLRRLLSFLILPFFIIGPLDVGLYFLYGDIGSLGIGIIVLLLGFTFLHARRLVDSGRLQRAVRVTFGGILAPIFLLVLFRPFLYPTLAAGVILATAIALPFVNRRSLGWVAGVSFAVACVVTVVGTTLHLQYGSSLPETIQTIDVAATILIVVALTLTMMWSFSGRLRDSLIMAEARGEALAAANEELQRADEAKGQFMNSAAHEINTPLTPMRIQMDLLMHHEDRLRPEERQRALRIIDRNTRRLIRLSQDLLDASRIQGGRVRLRRRPVDAGQVVEEAAEAMRDVAAKQGITLETEAERDLPVHADPVRLAQVVDVFLTNAFKFTPAGGQVKVTAVRDDQAVRITVADTGVGIPPDDLERVFEPFSQLDHVPEGRRPHGTGLGLHIARGLVEAHGGRAWAESHGPGHGSTFYATLPLNIAETDGPAASTLAEERPVRTEETARRG